MTKTKLEIVCANIESVIAAQDGGADRIELCDNLSEGGTTPSQGMIKVAREKLSIDLFVMIRPRSGDFLYSKDELEIMKLDIIACKELKVDGVVLGILTPEGTVDKEHTKELVDLASPMPVTFHRAFDMAADPWKALEDIIECGCSRILTSGQQSNAVEGSGRISKLIELAGEKIIIMPGGGIRPGNVASVIADTEAKEIHSSAKKARPSKMEFISDGIKMGGQHSNEYNVEITDVDVVKRLKDIISFI